MFNAGPASPALFGFELEAPTTVNEAAATRAARSRVALFSASETPKTMPRATGTQARQQLH